MFKLIYANGDSFVAGDELASKKYLPEFSETYTRDEFKKIDKEKIYKRFTKSTKKFGFDEKAYRQDNYDLAFPSIISKQLQTPIINRAYSGKSNQTICASVIDDLEMEILKNYKPEEILVIVGLTEFARLKFPSKSKGNSDTTSMMMAYGSGRISQEVQEYFIRETTDKFLITDNFLSISGLIYYLDKLGISYILSDSSAYSTNLSGINFYPMNDRLRKLFPQPDVIMTSHMNKSSEKVLCMLGHYTSVIHERHADKIIELLKQKYPDKL